MTDISIWQFPLSLLLSLAFLAGVALLWAYLPEGRFRRCLSGRTSSVVILACVALMTAVEGIWGLPLHRSPVFWAVAVLLMLSLGFAFLSEIRARKGVAGWLSHLGMFVLCFGAFWGAPDFVDAHLIATPDKADRIAVSRNGMAVPLPFEIRLKEFRTDFYEDGVSPKQYSSRLDIDGRESVTSVNHPCLKKGFFIYQADYDHDSGAYSVLKLVRDPWLPLIFLGLALMMAGAFLSLRLGWNSRLITAAVVFAAVLFTVLSVARINFGTLVPALRSWWFVPHLAMYMLAYSALAISLVTCILAMAGVRGDVLMPLSRKLFMTSSSLLLVGMCCGAVWAKAAWGDWWTWDAKECWAAVTWMMTLAGIHLPSGIRRRNAALLVCIVLSFLAMQVAWYGVEYLPAAQMSLHAYK